MKCSCVNLKFHTYLLLLVNIVVFAGGESTLPEFKPLEFVSEPVDTVAKVNERTQLSCSARYNNVPPSVYSWERNGELLTFWGGQAGQNNRYILANGSLNFDSVRDSGPSPDPGNYRCIAEVTEGPKVHRIASLSAKLEIAELSGFDIQPEDLVLRQGETAMFRCKANAKPNPIYSWTRNGVPISSSSSRVLFHMNGEVLEIRQISDGDDGQYKCRAENVIGDLTSSSATLRITNTEGRFYRDISSSSDQPPSPFIPTTAGSGLFGFLSMFGIGGEATSTSTAAPTKQAAIASVSSQLLNITTSDSDLVKSDFSFSPSTEGFNTSSSSTHNKSSRQTTTTPSLLSSVSPLSTSPSLVSSNHKTATQTLSTTTQTTSYHQTTQDETWTTTEGAPLFVMRPWDTSVVEGANVTLLCTVTGRDSRGNIPTITWLRDGSTIDTSGNGRFSIQGSGSLHITNTTHADTGMYICRGDNLEDVTDAEAKLTVLVPPYFVHKPQNTYGRLNEDVTLSCDIQGFPAPNVYWLKDSDLVKASDYFMIIKHNLKIMGLMKTDAGYYQCVGENAAGSIHAVSQLIVLSEGQEIPDSYEESDQVTASPLNTVIPTDSSLPPAPTSLQAVYVSHTYVTLSWTIILPPGVASVNTYTVTTLPTGNTEARVRTANTSSTDFTIEGLQPGTEYIFQVISYNRYGRSLRHAEIRVKTQVEAAVPEPVKNFNAWAVGYDAIAVNWDSLDASNGNIKNYRVYFYSTDQSSENYKVTTGNSMQLTDLLPYTQYHIRVVAENSNGLGSPTPELTIVTFSSKPGASPTNIELIVISTTSVELRWNPPPKAYQNGQITGYKIRYRNKDSSNKAVALTTDADARNQEITRLEPGATYQVKVAAMNINGTGEFSAWHDVETYTQELDESVAPPKPLYIQTKPFSREMIVSWAMPLTDIRVRGYQLGYGNVAPDEFWISDISPGTTIYTLEGLKPKSNYVVQVLAFNKAGNSESAQQQTFTRADDLVPSANSELTIPLEVIANVISPTSVLVRWYDSTLGPNQKPIDDREYTVKYNALSGSAQRRTQFKNSSDLFVTIDGLRPYTKYEFSVMVSKDNRASLYSLSARNTTFEAAPSDPPQDLTVTVLEDRPSYLMVSWQPSPRPNGNILKYTIYSNTNSEQPLEAWASELVDGHKLNMEFGPVTPSTVYYFRIAAHNSIGFSPPSDIKVIKTLEAVLPVRNGDNGPLPIRPDDSDSGRVPIYELPTVAAPDMKVDEVQTTQAPGGSGLPSTQTLWIIIACVSAVTVLAVVLLIVVLCRRKILYEKNKPANLKASNQAPKGMNKSSKQPDLWINQEQVELKAIMEKQERTEPDEMTSMLHSHSQFDVPSASMMGDDAMDEPRYSTLGRRRPMDAPIHAQRDAMPRAAVQPMTVDNSRPLYPRTQFTSQPYGSTPRVHMGDTVHPISDSYKTHNGFPVNKPFMMNGEEVPPPRPPPMENKYQMKSFSLASTPYTNNIPKHIVKPQPISAYKPPPPPPEYEQVEIITGSLKRPPRPPHTNNIVGSQNSLVKEPLNLVRQKTISTEQLSTEMANLDTLMQDLHAMKSNF